MSVNRSPYFGFNSTQEKSLRGLNISEPGAVDATMLADLGVTTAKINNLAVTTGKLAAGAVTNAKVDAAAAIAATKIAIAAGTEGLSAGTLQAELQAVRTLAHNLNVWAIALATKLNADAGVTDANYDTNPQA